MLTPLLGVIILIITTVVALSRSTSSDFGFLDSRAAIVVFGGVIGSLLVAIDRRALGRLIHSLRELFPAKREFSRQMRDTHDGLITMREAWRQGQRATILKMVDTAKDKDLQVAADTLIQQLPRHAIEERFAELRTHYNRTYGPVIEGWELVAKLAPSFGMLGTVTGVVQMFQNMSSSVGNIGGAMAMALLTTLYGVTLGAVVGGPMAARINSQLNDRLEMLDLIEKTITALISENQTVVEGGE